MGKTTLPIKSSVATSTATLGYTSHRQENLNQIMRLGQMGYIQIFVEYESGYEIGSSAPFATLPEGYRPSSNLRIPIIIKKNNVTLPAYAVLYTDGKLTEAYTSTGVQAVYVDSAFHL